MIPNWLGNRGLTFDRDCGFHTISITYLGM
jgi:hypothetical protein